MAKDRKNELGYNFFFLGIVQIINVLLQLLVIPYVIRIIGIGGYGVIAVAQVVILFLSAITDYGFNQTATKDISLNRTDKAAISVIFYRVLFSKLLLCLLAFLLLVILILCVPILRSHSLLYLLAFTFVIGQSLFVNWFFQGLEKMHFIALLTLMARVVFAALVFACIKKENEGILFLLFWGTGNLAAAVAGLFIAYRLLAVRFVKPAWKDVVQELKEGWPLTAANISIYSCQYLNVFILRIFTSDLVAGYYSIAEKIFFTLKQVLAVFSQAIYPKLCGVFRQGHKDVILFFKKTYVPFLLAVLGGSILVFVLALPILYFFVGNAAINSVFFLRVLSITTIVVCLNIPAYLLLLAANEKKNFLKVIMIGTIVNIALNVICVQLWEARGTVISVLITELFITVGLYREAYRLYLRMGETAGFSNWFFLNVNK